MFNLPVGVRVGIKMLNPWVIVHAPLNSSRFCHIKMPNVSLEWKH